MGKFRSKPQKSKRRTANANDDQPPEERFKTFSKWLLLLPVIMVILSSFRPRQL
jgi:hypothetical protein